MPLEIRSSSETEVNSREEDCTRTIFESREHMKESLSRLCYGNLYIIGSMWIEALKTVLTGSKMCLVPTIHAAKKDPEPPKKPPRMKYTQLPMYEQPYREYQEFIEDQKKSKYPNADVKILQTAIQPYVSVVRKSAVHKICLVKHYTTEYTKLACELFDTKKKEVKAIARDPEYLKYRQAAVGLGAFTGLIIARKKRLTLKLVYSTIGLLTMGWLCFPKETDKEFKNTLYTVSRALVSVFSYACGAGISLPVLGPCESDKPGPVDPKAKKEVDPCPKKK